MNFEMLNLLLDTYTIESVIEKADADTKWSTKTRNEKLKEYVERF